MTSELRVDAIKNTAGTQAMSIDNGGRVTTPTRPFFNVTMINSSSGAAGATGHIIFNTITTNQGSHWNSGGGYFLVPIDGVYQFNFTGFGADSTAGSSLNPGVDVECRIEVSTDNGSSYSGIGASYSYASGDYTRIPLNLSVSALLTANARVRLNFNEEYMFYNDADDDLAPDGTPHFSGYLVG